MREYLLFALCLCSVSGYSILRAHPIRSVEIISDGAAPEPAHFTSPPTPAPSVFRTPELSPQFTSPPYRQPVTFIPPISATGRSFNAFPWWNSQYINPSDSRPDKIAPSTKGFFGSGKLSEVASKSAFDSAKQSVPSVEIASRNNLPSVSNSVPLSPVETLSIVAATTTISAKESSTETPTTVEDIETTTTIEPELITSTPSEPITSTSSESITTTSAEYITTTSSEQITTISSEPITTTSSESITTTSSEPVTTTSSESITTTSSEPITTTSSEAVTSTTVEASSEVATTESSDPVTNVNESRTSEAETVTIPATTESSPKETTTKFLIYVVDESTEDLSFLSPHLLPPKTEYRKNELDPRFDY